MNKFRYLATAFLYASVVFLAAPVYAISESVTNPAMPHQQEVVSNSILTDTPVLSDELWLVISAMIALGGIIIVNRTIKQADSRD